MDTLHYKSIFICCVMYHVEQVKFLQADYMIGNCDFHLELLREMSQIFQC